MARNGRCKTRHISFVRSNVRESHFSVVVSSRTSSTASSHRLSAAATTGNSATCSGLSCTFLASIGS